MKREAGEKGSRTKNRGLKPLGTAKQTFGIKRKFKRKPSRKERNKWNLRQLRCSGAWKLSGLADEPKVAWAAIPHCWQGWQGGCGPWTWRLHHYSRRVTDETPHFKKKKKKKISGGGYGTLEILEPKEHPSQLA